MLTAFPRSVRPGRQGRLFAHRNRLSFEQLETRVLLSADGLGVIHGAIGFDSNGNGVTDFGEEVTGATVELYRDNGNSVFDQSSDTLVETAVTDANGSYSFGGLDVDNYFVVQPAQRVGSLPLTESVSSQLTTDTVTTTVIDVFDSASGPATASFPVPMSVQQVHNAADSLGAQRDFDVQLIEGDFNDAIQLRTDGGFLLLNSDISARGEYVVTWDGLDDVGDGLSANGLGGVDFTGPNTAGSGICLSAVQFDQPNATISVRVYTDQGNWSEATIADVPSLIESNFFIPFVGTRNGIGFRSGDGLGADFTDVGAVELVITANSIAMDGQIDDIAIVGGTFETADFVNVGLPAIDVEVFTNGASADSVSDPDVPMLTIGVPISWSYVVTNTGQTDLTNVEVTDSNLGPVIDISDQGDGDAVLSPGETWTLVAIGTALEGVYENAGTAVAAAPSGISVSDVDLSHYLGIMPNPLVVTNTLDGGLGSLRDAIFAANAMSGPQTISFEIPLTDAGFEDGVFVIQPDRELPSFRDASGGTRLDAASQIQFTGDTNPHGPEVVLDGSSLAADGITIMSSDNEIRGLNIRGFAGAGILVFSADTDTDTSADRNFIAGNYIGTDETGSFAIANQGDGILILDADDTVIGGVSSNEPIVNLNIISGNQGNGIFVGTLEHTAGMSSRTQIQANLIGTDSSGQSALPNGGHGVHVASADATRIGEPNTSVVSSQAISGNLGSGILLEATVPGTSVTNTEVFGYSIGYDAGRSLAVPNGADGITISTAATDSVIGGSDFARVNWIGGNAGNGIRITGENATRMAPINWFDFSTWNHDAVTSTGQTFDDVFTRVDLNVLGAPVSSLRSEYDAQKNAIVTGDSLNEHSFLFDFTAPLDLFVDVRSVDVFETVEIAGSDDQVNYVHAFGAFPTVNSPTPPDDFDLSLTGNGIRFGSFGSSRGLLSLGMTQSFDWTYRADSTNKFESFRVGVREPGTRFDAPANNVIAGNFIGGQSNGLGNQMDGVLIEAGGSNNTVGATNNGLANFIIGNQRNGIAVTGPSIGNSFRANLIQFNGGIPIDLGANGGTPNDLLDSDPGPNNLTNFPTLVSFTAGDTTLVSGSLSASPNTGYEIDFFSGPTPSDAANFLGTISVVTDASGFVEFTNIEFQVLTNDSDWLTATATALTAIDVNTSEFATAIEATTGFTIRGNVGRDLNRDRIRDGAAGVAGLSVFLKNQNGDIVQATTTDASGDYVFHSVATGEYVVSIELRSREEQTFPVGGFRESRFSTGKPMARSIVPFDMDLDNDIDFAVISAIPSPGNYEGSIVLWESDGNGQLVQAQDFTVTERPHELIATDLDANGQSELVVAFVGDGQDPDTGRISIFWNVATNGFLDEQILAIGTGPIAIDVNDFDADGNTDIAIASFRDDSVSIFSSQGNRTFRSATTSVDGQPIAIASGDINGDALPDLIIANYLGDNIAWLPNLGSGFSGAQELLQGVGPSGVVVGDFNNDGMNDVAASFFGRLIGGVFVPADSLQVMFSATTAAQSTQEISLQTSSRPGAIRVGDFDADGDLDLAVVESDLDRISTFVDSGFGVVPHEQIPASRGIESIAITNINTDGHPDIIAVGISGDVVVAPYFNEGINIAVGSGPLDQINFTVFTPTLDSSASSSTLDISADVNRNGAVDPMDALIIINYLNGQSANADSNLDIDRDGVISPVDALAVINRIARSTQPYSIRDTIDEELADESFASQDMWELILLMNEL